MRKIDAIFNYEQQIYKSIQGTIVKPENNWDFPCPVCKGPAEMLGCDCYNEYHECLNCGNKFNVN